MLAVVVVVTRMCGCVVVNVVVWLGKCGCEYVCVVVGRFVRVGSASVFVVLVACWWRVALQQPTNRWPDPVSAQIEDSFHRHVVVDNRPAMLDILDTAGQEVYFFCLFCTPILPALYRAHDRTQKSF